MPTFSQFRCTRRLLALGLALAFLLAGPPAAWAQRTAGPQPATIAPAQYQCATGQGLPTETAYCPAETYWIVSLRCCPQKARAPICPCCADFLVRTADGCLQRSNNAEFVASLQPCVPVCLMIHGSYVTWEDAQVDAANTFRWIRGAAPHLPLHYVYITWPSDPTLPPFDLVGLGRKSARNGFQLAHLVQTIPCHNPVSFIGHSHGARMALSTLHLLGGGVVQGYSLAQPPGASHRYRAVLAAAAVDHHWLNPGERYGCALPITECVMSMRTRRDRALAFYPMRYPFAKESLGRKGFTKKDLRKLGPHACRVGEYDVTCYVEDHHFWQFYNRHAELAQLCVPYVYYPDLQQVQTGPAAAIPASAAR